MKQETKDVEEHNHELVHTWIILTTIIFCHENSLVNTHVLNVSTLLLYHIIMVNNWGRCWFGTLIISTLFDYERPWWMMDVNMFLYFIILSKEKLGIGVRAPETKIIYRPCNHSLSCDYGARDYNYPHQNLKVWQGTHAIL